MDIYTEMNRISQSRLHRDFIMRLFLQQNTDELNSEIEYIIMNCPTLGDASPRLCNALKKVRSNSDRSAKHAVVAFAIYNDDFYRERIVSGGRVNTLKFQNFYDNSLKKETENLLDGRLVCLQDYIETIRSEWIMS
jgi:hypothetical protein